MIRWIPYTFVRLLLFYCAGVVLALAAPEIIPGTIASLILFALVATYGVVALCFRKIHVHAGVLGLTAVLVAGYVTTLIRTPRRWPGNITAVSTPIRFYQAVVSASPQPRATAHRVEVSLRAVKTDSGWQHANGNVMLYVRRHPAVASLRYGDVIVVKGTPRSVAPPGNPGEFDYKKYLSNRGIYHQHFVMAADVMVQGNDPPNILMYYAIALRQRAGHALRDNITGSREQALASALVLGVTDTLDDGLLDAYSATGTLHVLSVSGLHVGILYAVLLLLFKPFRTLPGWAIALASLLVLWTYAFVSGLSPSVLRAVTMFSFIAVGRVLGRGANIYNTLAASAFCLLVYDPFMLLSVGFQLSYLAVLGIVYLQPPLYRLWEPRAWLWDEVWKMTSVSLAAQTATFALGLLYFHQFPNYFLFSNLLAIPLSSAVLVGGLGVIVLSVIQPIAQWAGWLLTWAIKLLNGVVFFAESLPGSVTEQVFITPVQFVCIIAALIMSIRLVETRRFVWVVMTAACCLVFSALQWIHYYNDIAIQKMTVYNVNGSTAIDFIDHGCARFFGDSSLAVVNNKKVDFHLLPNRIHAGIATVAAMPGAVRDVGGCRLIVWKGKTILQIHTRGAALPDDLPVDCVLVSNNAAPDLQRLLEKVHADVIVIDSSNSLYFANKLLKQAAALHVNVRSVLHEGAINLYLSSV